MTTYTPRYFSRLDFLGKKIAFLARHGKKHQFPPHRVPQRANIWALKELGVEKGSINSSETKSGNLTLEQVVNVVNAKKDIFLSRTFKNAVKSVLGTALSVGATVEGEDPRVVQKKIDDGEYDDRIKGEV